VATSFDERAADWDDEPQHRDRARAAAAAIRETVELGPHVRTLEYGAGTGLLSQELATNVGPLTVTDPSAGMRDVIQAKIDAGVLPEARVADLDLSRDPAPDERYDLVVAMMTLHHVPQLAPVLTGFAQLLDPGGTLCVVDLEEEDGSFHGDGDVHEEDEEDAENEEDASHVEAGDHDGFHGHNGFARDELSEWLTDAGFGPTRFERCYEMQRNGQIYGVFLATCRRTHRT
jgi:SAM-dependent methyltransferase